MFFVDNFTNVEKDTASVYAEWQRDKASFSTTIGTRYTRVDMDAGLAGSNMVMMNPAIASLVDDFNAAERSKSYNMLDIAASTRYHASDNVDVVLGVSQKTVPLLTSNAIRGCLLVFLGNGRRV